MLVCLVFHFFHFFEVFCFLCLCCIAGDTKLRFASVFVFESSFFLCLRSVALFLWRCCFKRVYVNQIFILGKIRFNACECLEK